MNWGTMGECHWFLRRVSLSLWCCYFLGGVSREKMHANCKLANKIASTGIPRAKRLELYVYNVTLIGQLQSSWYGEKFSYRVCPEWKEVPVGRIPFLYPALYPANVIFGGQIARCLLQPATIFYLITSRFWPSVVLTLTWDEREAIFVVRGMLRRVHMYMYVCFVYRAYTWTIHYNKGAICYALSAIA